MCWLLSTGFDVLPNTPGQLARSVTTTDEITSLCYSDYPPWCHLNTYNNISSVMGFPFRLQLCLAHMPISIAPCPELAATVQRCQSVRVKLPKSFVFIVVNTSGAPQRDERSTGKKPTPPKRKFHIHGSTTSSLKPEVFRGSSLSFLSFASRSSPFPLAAYQGETAECETSRVTMLC